MLAIIVLKETIGNLNLYLDEPFDLVWCIPFSSLLTIKSTAHRDAISALTYS
jgi:hypothetical protein